MKNILSTALFVALIAIYSLFTLFIFVPFFVGMLSRTLLIVLVSFFMISAHIIYFYVLRKEHPLIWLIAMPIEFVIVCILSIFNNHFIINSLEFYGIYSVFSQERDAVLTAAPYYVDAFFLSVLMLSAREACFIPVYYYSRSKEKDAKKNSIKKEIEVEATKAETVSSL